MTSQEILPENERLNQLNLIVRSPVNLDYCVKYHQALEASESKVKELELKLTARKKSHQAISNEKDLKIKELELLLEKASVKLKDHADKYQVGNRRINDLMEKVVDPAIETAKRNEILEEEIKVLIEVIENTTSREYSGILEHQKEIERLNLKINEALKFIREKRPTTPGLGALEVILGKYE